MASEPEYKIRFILGAIRKYKRKADLEHSREAAEEQKQHVEIAYKKRNMVENYINFPEKSLAKLS